MEAVPAAAAEMQPRLAAADRDALLRRWARVWRDVRREMMRDGAGGETEQLVWSRVKEVEGWCLIWLWW